MNSQLAAALVLCAGLIAVWLIANKRFWEQNDKKLVEEGVLVKVIAEDDPISIIDAPDDQPLFADTSYLLFVELSDGKIVDKVVKISWSPHNPPRKLEVGEMVKVKAK